MVRAELVLVQRKIAKFNTEPISEAKIIYVTKLVSVQRGKFVTRSTSPGTNIITIDTPIALRSELRYNTVIFLLLYSGNEQMLLLVVVVRNEK